MRDRCMAVAAALAIGLWVAPGAGADQVEEQLQQMQERLGQLEDRLQATTDRLEAANQRAEQQQELIERAGIADGTGATSGLASFLETLEVGGWVNASYWYNTNDPDNNNLDDFPNTGLFGTSNPFNPDHNTFSLDQLWFELERPVDESHRAGFRTDITFGKLGGFLGGSSRVGIAGEERDLYVHQGYVQYLAPIGSGVHFKAGKFATLIGYEVIQAPYNNQISRGLVWNLLQPIDHVGVMASIERSGWDASVGYVNGFSPVDPDTNDGKSVLGRIGYTGENYSIAVAGIHGAEAAGDEHPKLSVVDLIVTWDPHERLSLWANGDFLRADPDTLSEFVRGDARGDAHAWGAAVGGRIAITDRTGFSVRGEYVRDDGAVFTGLFTDSRSLIDAGALDDFPSVADPIDATIWSATGTIDHKLTDNLIVRGEVRWDRGRLDDVRDNLFLDDSGSSLEFLDDDQLLVGVDVTYLFN